MRSSDTAVSFNMTIRTQNIASLGRGSGKLLEYLLGIVPANASICDTDAVL